jgi:two-component system response regulator HydG
MVGRIFPTFYIFTDMEKLLIIDDDTEICLLLSRFLSGKGFTVETAFNGKSGLKALIKSPFDAIISDFRLPDLGGFDLIQEFRKKAPKTPLIVITGYSDVRMAVKAMKMGVHEYVTKPIQADELLLVLKDALEKRSEESDSEHQAPKKKAKPTKGVALSSQVEVIYGDDAKSKAIQQNIDLIAPTSLSVIVSGETGTGKEITAREIHRKSPRNTGPFVSIDCGAIPKDLAGSVLFGHRKGAFTGAHQDKKGVFERANGGSLFLDEIGNLSYPHQVQLLRAIQERVVRPVGSNDLIPVDVRIIVATNESLRKSIDDGDFREDLYFRLNEFSIQLSPLRERPKDIPSYAEHFLQLANERLNKNIKGFEEEYLSHLMSYPWHGNLRELKNIVQRSALMSQGDRIPASVLPQEIKKPQLIQNEDLLDLDAFSDLKTVTEHAERRAIQNTLERTQHNKSKTAELLGIDRKTLYNKMKHLGIS